MKLTYLIIIFSLIGSDLVLGQNENQMSDSLFQSIPDYPSEYSAINVAIRLIDGLGYRYHWASKNLREKDIEYSPGNEGQTALETLQHIYDLSETIVRVIQGNVIDVTKEQEIPDYPELRQRTLENLWEARTSLQEVNSLDSLKVVYQRGERQSAFPFWNLINGHISDALYHTGQIVSFRRTSGNPIEPKVNVFSGKNRK